MHQFLKAIRDKASRKPKKIVFPEGSEERILRATAEIIKNGIAEPILVGEAEEIKLKAEALEIKINWEKVKIYSVNNPELRKKLSTRYFELRKHKGITLEQATEILGDFNYFGTMLVEKGIADGMVTGTTYPTADSIRPALQTLRIKEKFHKVSGVFFMIMEERLLLFADAAITVEPTAEELAAIAIDTAKTAEKFGIKPKVALLSFSTFSSANHPEVDKIKKTIDLIQEKEPYLTIANQEMQVDAALVPKVAKKKCPKSEIQGDATVLIFPDLEAANIAYKLVERLGKAEAIGPILQGLTKPINDLSRGCSFEDIVNITAFTVCECEE